jgi:hypothetical protein
MSYAIESTTRFFGVVLYCSCSRFCTKSMSESPLSYLTISPTHTTSLPVNPQLKVPEIVQLPAERGFGSSDA